jgi:GNAT superfamily N-acetyltransferase
VYIPLTVVISDAFQRVACGWYLDRVPRWIHEIASNKRFLWFIHFGTMNPHTGNIVAQSPAIGMISLYLDNPDDPTLASFALTSRVEITSLFARTPFLHVKLPYRRLLTNILQVYASYRHLGIGATAIREMERRAKAFGATHTTFNTMAVDRHLRVFKEELGYREYKARKPSYSVADIVGAGWPSNYSVAAFLEKEL